LLLEPIPHHDDRGWFSRTFDASIARSAGIDPDGFVQDSQSRSHRGVVRGLHGRRGGGESKLVRCAHGTIHDVVVDARPQSPTFGRWQAFELDDVTLHSLYIPPGFLHGFQVLTPTADICYRIDAEHNPDEDLAVRWDDPELAVHWPLPASTVSERDQAAGSWTDLRRLLVPAAPR
jgi:dTDP-4-dehydrorhamnose 3,5-epimerase